MLVCNGEMKDEESWVLFVLFVGDVFVFWRLTLFVRRSADALGVFEEVK